MIEAADRLQHAVGSCFGRGHVLVVGDLMLDSYIWGEVGRVSPEAPVPVVRVVRRTANPGGAGNVMLNLAGLGLRVSAAGWVGGDGSGDRLVDVLGAAGVDTRAVSRWDDRPTVTKTRVVGGHQQVVRVDEEDLRPIPTPCTERFLSAVAGLFRDGLDAVVLSDYSKGTLTPEVCGALIAEANRRGVPVLVDPKGRDFRKYAGATVLTPNRAELETATGLPASDDASIEQAGNRLRGQLSVGSLVVTRSEQGISVLDASGVRHFPARAREVFDVSGAGDTVISVLAAGMVAGLSLDASIHLANLAAGVVVGKVGTVPIRADELAAALRAEDSLGQSDKVCDLRAARERVAAWRSRGERVVFTNGCYDLLHVGHVTLLEKAGAEGDRLVIGLNSDASVRGLKGESRPVIPQDDRARILAAMRCVDAVVVFDEETPLRLIEALRPDVLVKGGDYSEDQVVGADLVRSWGGDVVLIPVVPGRSTTRIVSLLRGSAAGGAPAIVN